MLSVTECDFLRMVGLDIFVCETGELAFSFYLNLKEIALLLS